MPIRIAPSSSYLKKKRTTTATTRQSWWHKYVCHCCFKCAKKVPQIFVGYVALLVIIHWNVYKEALWWQNQRPRSAQLEQNAKANAKNASAQQHNRQHLFIYSSFIYDRRQPAGANKTDHDGTVQLVVLYLAEKSHSSTMDGIQCAVEKNAITVKRMATKKEQVISLGVCALDLFLLTCTSDAVDGRLLMKRATSNNDDHLRSRVDNHDEDAKQIAMYSLILPKNSDSAARRQQNGAARRPHTDKILLNPRRPSYKPRGLVLCMSRVFLYERWQLLVTGLEAYRLFKVDLVVAHVQSALLSVFKLLKAYEQLGLLKIMPGIRLPHQRGMKWDPNAETEFNGQILLAHECFYEYRESAQFIGLIDWDDLLVPSRHFATLPAAFSAAFAQNPDTAYFLVNKIEASFVEQRVRRPTEFSMRKMLRDGIRTAEMYNDEKMVVRPKALRGFWMHNSFNMEPMKRIVKLFTNYSLLLHLANDERVNLDEFQTPFMNKYNINEMDRHASKQLQKLSRLHLPSSQPFYHALVTCHSQIFAFYKSVGPTRSGCLSYSLCALPQLPKAICTVTRSTFDTVMSSEEAVIHVRKSSEFGLERCVLEQGGI